MSEPVTVTDKSWQGAFSAFELAVKRIRGNPKPFLVMAAAYVLAGIVNAIALSNNPDGSPSYELILSLIFLVALPTYALSLADNKKISFGTAISASAKKYFLVLGVTLLIGLVLAASIILLVVPLIWAVAWYSMATYPVIENKARPVAALKRSKEISRGHGSKVWGIVGVTLLCSIVVVPLSYIPAVGAVLAAALTGMIGIVSTTASATLYRWLEAEHSLTAK